MRVLPSQVVQAIESLIGAKSTDIDERRVKHHLLAEVNSVLALLNDVPTALIDLPFSDYLELTRCRAVLAAAAGGWVLGDSARVARDVGGKDPVECIRRLMKQCQDELPPPEPELPFVDDPEVRAGIEIHMRTAWRNFDSQDWLGSTTFAAVAIEAVLLWALEQGKVMGNKPANTLYLSDLIDEAQTAGLISKEAAAIAHQSKEARNLIHPGKVAREGISCTKASALTGLAGLYRVIEDLKAAYG